MRTKTGIALGLVMLVLSACAAEMKDWQGPTDKSHRVAWMVASHEMAFEPGSRWLAEGELSHLDAFLGTLDMRRPTHVYVQSNGAGGELGQKRKATLHALLRARGVRLRENPPEPGHAGALPNGPSSGDSALLMVGHYDVSVPNCNDQSKPMIGDFSNIESSNFGCASAVNLGMMVADPRDLNGRAAEDHADGVRTAAPIGLYRAGKEPVLPATSSISGLGGN